VSNSNPIVPPPTKKPDYTLPIARTGEQQFAAIVRQRSGFDAGNIDMAVRDVSHMSDADQQEVVDSAYAIYETVRGQTGKIARRDRQNIGPG
jgi:hypothetical protein